MDAITRATCAATSGTTDAALALRDEAGLHSAVSC